MKAIWDGEIYIYDDGTPVTPKSARCGSCGGESPVRVESCLIKTKTTTYKKVKIPKK